MFKSRTDGRAAPILKSGQGEEALAAIRLLEKSSLGVGLLEAVKQHINAERRRLASKPVGEVVVALVSAKKRSEKYCSSLKRTQRRLDPLRAVLVSEISSDDLAKIIGGASDSYRNALLREIRAIFSFAVRRGWCIANPATKLDFAQTQIGERDLYSPEESALLLETGTSTRSGITAICGDRLICRCPGVRTASNGVGSRRSCREKH